MTDSPELAAIRASVERDAHMPFVHYAQKDARTLLRMLDKLAAEYATYRADGEPELRAANARVQALEAALRRIRDRAGWDGDAAIAIAALGPQSETTGERS
jgi:hypothetical protein